jgi:hypothetical protein
MGTHSSDRKLLRAIRIQQVNDALIVMRHFIDLNGKLLPILHDLTYKKLKSKRDLEDIQKIKLVFVSYQFNTDTSVLFMESNVLELIQNAYTALFNCEEEIQTKQKLVRFQNEYLRLKSNWKSILLN